MKTNTISALALFAAVSLLLSVQLKAQQDGADSGQTGDGDASACASAKPSCSDINLMSNAGQKIQAAAAKCPSLVAALNDFSSSLTSDSWHDGATRRCFVGKVVQGLTSACSGACQNCALPKKNKELLASALDWLIPSAHAIGNVIASCGVCKDKAEAGKNSALSFLSDFIGAHSAEACPQQ